MSSTPGAPPSPLAGIGYDPARGEFDHFRFVASPRDDQVLRLVDEWSRLDPRRRAEVRAALTMDDFYTLLTFARRRSLSALRGGDPTIAGAGIDAISMIDLERIDWRDAVVETALLSYAMRRTGSDPAPALGAAALASEPGIAGVFDRFVDEPVARLTRWGFREVSTRWGTGLASDYGRPFHPTIDLVGMAVEVAELVERDVWRVRDITTGTGVPATWLRNGESDTIESALGSLRAGVSVRAILPAAAAPRASDQHLIAFLAELADGHAAGTVARYAGPGPRGGFAALGVAAGSVCVVAISSSVMAGVEPYERAGSLERFRAGLATVLGGRS